MAKFLRYRFLIFLLLCQVGGAFSYTVSLQKAFAGNAASEIHEVDVALIGGGIMSATLGMLLKRLDPRLKIEVYERLDQVAAESSDTLNNAGTGHAALCELNYTPEKADGTIDISKALRTNEEFEISKQFWAYLVERGLLGQSAPFINTVPHFSWVRGEEDVQYLRKRYKALMNVPLFEGIEYSENAEQLREWMPLMMQGRNPLEPVAATRSLLGTDVDFGKLTRLMFSRLSERDGAGIFLGHEVRGLRQDQDSIWQLNIRDLRNKKTRRVRAKVVFIGAGGAALPLLQRSGIEQAKGYGGFPVSGEFLVSKNPALAEIEFGKVYGKAAVGSPPMSVPHLDTRIIDGKRALIFGPFAGATTRFLKHGSSFDLLRSLRADNMGVMIKAGYQNLPLVRYLVTQELQGHEDHMRALRDFVPDARSDEWELVSAGKRVQIIKQKPGQVGVLQFGTEVVSSEDGTLAALLGASPGASTSVSVMLEVLERSFGNQMATKKWKRKLREMIPSYGKSLAKNAGLTKKVRAWSASVLGLGGANCDQLLTLSSAVGGQ